VSFAVPPESYDRFMGVYSVQLAPQLAELAGVVRGQRVLDVGCGPGALSTELVTRLGPAAVSAVDPSETFVAAARERLPGVAVERASAEHLPFPDDSFDAALAQLVVHVRHEGAGCVPERRERALAAGMVPDAGGDDPARPGHARHLAEARDGVGHEVHDELCECGVERIVRKRKLFGRRLFHRDAGKPLACGRDEALRRVDCAHRVRAEAPD